MSDGDVKSSDPGASVEQVLAQLLDVQQRHNLPALTSICAYSHRAAVRLDTETYMDVCAWSDAFEGPYEPDRLVVGAEGLVFYTATVELPAGWSFDVTAKVRLGGDGIVLDDDMLDALELVWAGLATPEPTPIEIYFDDDGLDGPACPDCVDCQDLEIERFSAELVEAL